MSGDSKDIEQQQVSAEGDPVLQQGNGPNQEPEQEQDNQQEQVHDLYDHGGLTTQQAEELLQVHGYNELPVVTVSLWWVFLMQFTGTMPYMLELACIISLAVQDFADFGIIFAMLCANGILGFHEQLKAAQSLAELTNKMEQKIAVLRDGKAEQLLTRDLVPGDIVLLIGGCVVPADIEWLDGDVLSVDTAALTGEPLPRKYPSEEYGKLILCSCTIRAGEAYGIVRKTGINTEIGSANADILKDKTEVKMSVFEARVLLAGKVLIIVSLVDVLLIFLVQGFARNEFLQIHELLLTCLSIIIAAVPVALPLVLQVTMALGAGKMAREFDAVVTALPALQDISSMTVLCSDKTGTLTTARISIHGQSVWTSSSKFSKEDVALYGVLASNPDKKEDPIDRSVLQHYERVFGSSKGRDQLSEYTKVRSVGFNPIYKRVLYEYTHPRIGRIVIAKGLPTKVLDTADGGEDDAADQWVVKDADSLRDTVRQVDLDFSTAGYKTLGVVVKINDEPFEYCGILPMLDPPRHDTAQTICNLKSAGVEVKMITGDHLNIAKETARLIGLGVNIHRGEETREEINADRNELIRASNGFAQVLPRDKREVVLVLRDTYKQVVGMTGDGVNDAPALSAAQCGIAVDDATDAAKNAAAIILTSPGLSAIYSAVVESRRIFRKLKAYVTFRFAATIQIVSVLTLLIFVSNCSINSLYIVLLALLNDLTMLPIAYDYQVASSLPEDPQVTKILIISIVLGLTETAMSLIFAYCLHLADFLRDEFIVGSCSVKTQSIIWVQMFIAAELLIFSTRAPSFFVVSLAPSPALCCSVLLGCLLVSLMAGLSTQFGGLDFYDILTVWVYNIAGLFIVDIIKVVMFRTFNENMETLSDIADSSAAAAVSSPPTSAKEAADLESNAAAAAVPSARDENEDGEVFTRHSLASQRLDDMITTSRAGSSSKISAARAITSPQLVTTGGANSDTRIATTRAGSDARIATTRAGSAARITAPRTGSDIGITAARTPSNSRITAPRAGSGARIVINSSSGGGMINLSSSDLRPSLLLSGSLRPNVPHHKKRA